jgi:prophage regulatory protein
MHNIDPVISSSELLKLIPFSRAHLYRLEKAGHFPCRIKLGARRIGWRMSAIEEWLSARSTPNRVSADCNKVK